MLEPLIAVGLAANIIQFVDYATRLLSKAGEIRQHGSSLEIRDLKLTTEDLRKLTSDIECSQEPLSESLTRQNQNPSVQSNGGGFSRDEVCPIINSLQKLHRDPATGCKAVSQELIAALSDLQSTTKLSRWKSIRQALKTTWGTDKLDQTSQRLQNFRDQLTLRILVSFRSDANIQAAVHDSRFDTLEQGLQSIIRDFMDEKGVLMTELNRHTDTFEKRQDRIEHLHRHYFDQTIAAIQRSHSVDPIYLSRPNEAYYQLKGGDQSQIQQAVLDHLQFRQMNTRIQDVAPAHKDTFQWLFDENIARRPWSSFLDWLQSGSGCYWINGKAASGKTTLMKFILSHPMTKVALATWSGGEQVLIPSFFFWNAGILLQKAQVGLYRATLFEVLSCHKEIIFKIFPELYHEEARRNQHPQLQSTIQPLSDTELKVAFMKMLDHIPSRICFFIDGIDETEGDTADIVSLIKLVASKPMMKVVVSSRPISPCVQAFQDCPSLRLQDLTMNDIQAYVNAQMCDHQLMKQLFLDMPHAARTLVAEIVTKSSGVFLWVMLVVKSLTQGLENHDRIEHLQHRLGELPSELHDIYRLMLSNLEPLYRQQASKLLQVALRHHESETLYPLLLMRLAWADLDDPKIATKLYHDSNEVKNIGDLCENMRVRLQSCCRGLLEVQGHMSQGTSVGFLHRTVIEFLSECQNYQYLQDLTKDISFDPNISLLSSSLVWLKGFLGVWPPTRMNEHHVDDMLVALLHRVVIIFMYGRLAETSTGKPCLDYLRECDSDIENHWEHICALQHGKAKLNKTSHWALAMTRLNRCWQFVHSFPSLMAAAGLGLSLDQYLKESPECLSDLSKQDLLIDIVYHFGEDMDDYVAAHQISVVKTLLKHSADPNKPTVDKSSAWTFALLHFDDAMSPAKLSHYPEWQGLVGVLLEIMVEHGADPNAVQSRVIFPNTASRFLEHSPTALSIVQCSIANLKQIRPTGSEDLDWSLLVKLMEDRGRQHQDRTPVDEPLRLACHSIMADKSAQAQARSLQNLQSLSSQRKWWKRRKSGAR
ncbi:uncharacterized protein KY384_001252 [Bacidia gigantensis]|uniref:uncharacterized protein n=1 Tax=Bacidia gigantensis TaxID=2732470 RepID=UPI001D04A40B|nr:uncharacterized protein KY384_001252 [Bacidia gigantensis]KAG8534407.1 hypothetical protein KY384_001252 [Bacidia gigantensis]